VLLAWLTASEPTNPGARAVAYIGSHSYSLYLWHLAVNTIVVTFVRESWWMYASSYLVGSIVVGIAASRLIEFPVLRLRDHYWPDLAASRDQPITQRDAVGAV
jgi:peptidoglycan/LPS O-acetylase OafA/YrhL